MAREIGGSNRRRGRRTMPATRKATLPEMVKEYAKLGMSKNRKASPSAAALRRRGANGMAASMYGVKTFLRKASSDMDEEMRKRLAKKTIPTSTKKSTATQLAKRGAVPVKPAAKKPAGSNSAGALQKLRSMR